MSYVKRFDVDLTVHLASFSGHVCASRTTISCLPFLCSVPVVFCLKAMLVISVILGTTVMQRVVLLPHSFRASSGAGVTLCVGCHVFSISVWDSLVSSQNYAGELVTLNFRWWIRVCLIPDVFMISHSMTNL